MTYSIADLHTQDMIEQAWAQLDILIPQRIDNEALDDDHRLEVDYWWKKKVDRTVRSPIGTYLAFEKEISKDSWDRLADKINDKLKLIKIEHRYSGATLFQIWKRGMKKARRVDLPTLYHLQIGLDWHGVLAQAINLDRLFVRPLDAASAEIRSIVGDFLTQGKNIPQILQIIDLCCKLDEPSLVELSATAQTLLSSKQP